MNKSPIYIVADDDIPFLKGVLEPYAQVLYKSGELIDTQDVREADVLLTRTRTRCNAALLSHSQIKLIATATIGYDHIDLPYCQAHGIRVETSAGCNARGVLQYIMGALVALSEREKWQPQERTLGVIGAGNVGGLIAEYGRLLGFRVLVCDPPKKTQEPTLNFISLEELLPVCDIVTLHVPYTHDGKYATSHMINASFLEQMKPHATLINTSRGGIMQEDLLLEALQQKRLNHAVIDTWNGEPNINRELLSLSTFATPHIAGYSIQGKAAATASIVRSVARHFQLPLTKWYPEGITPSKADPTLTWERLKTEIQTRFDIEAESRTLKAHPADFEQLRNHYAYRDEFF